MLLPNLRLSFTFKVVWGAESASGRRQTDFFRWINTIISFCHFLKQHKIFYFCSFMRIKSTSSLWFNGQSRWDQTASDCFTEPIRIISCLFPASRWRRHVGESRKSRKMKRRTSVNCRGKCEWSCAAFGTLCLSRCNFNLSFNPSVKCFRAVAILDSCDVTITRTSNRPSCC